MFNSMGQSNPQDLGNGGTLDGDVTITGDLTVSGGIGLTLSEVIEGTSTIDVTNTEAFLVRKNGDGGDIFTVDTTNSQITIGGSADEKLMLKGSNNPYIRFYESTSAKAYIQWHSDGYMQLENSETGTTLRLADSITISDASSGSPKLILYNSNTSGSQSSHLDFQQASTSQADDQQLGYVSFSGYRDNDSSIETMVSMAALCLI